MLRDREGRPVGDWFDLHAHETGADVETRWDGPVPCVTPTERFFVRNHTTAPEIDPGAWRLLISGDGVQRETVWSLADLRRLTSVTLEVALECTGNGRRFFGDQQGTPRPGTPWRFGAIGVARWSGVPLSQLLDHAGLRRDAVQVTPVGLDDRYVVDGVDHGRVRRPLPLPKAMDDVLVALDMNGEPLARDHGFPARLVVPGWVGIASIKWLGELRVTRTEVDSPWNTLWYRMHGPGWEGADAELGRLPVKSVLDEQGDGDPTVGREVRLAGRAWAGEAAVERVEVSTDGGRTWRRAELDGDNLVNGWAHWELPWTPDRAGDHEIRVRATDTTGRTQPDRATDNDDGYLFDAVMRHPVRVREPGR
ncbi:sulfite oxidase [Nocardioides sp. GXQ0305]|uniref:sulfite oxidase n=1 Tax=Nocardioides sp. GXQ0305 TaxID=3423912 RepID=UPI003D7D2094